MSCVVVSLLKVIETNRCTLFVPCACIFFRYLRIPSNTIVSEATEVVYLRKSVFRMFARNPHLSIPK